ncbi:MAG: lamin tail domain-containing protein [Bernardetiaceae bacterium]|nr:lamin tail domain-containing protein [Bernardetiaceae bacterium]
MMKKNYLYYMLSGLAFFVSQIAEAQLIDDFSDGDFTTAPTWDGRFYLSTVGISAAPGYVVVGGELRSDVPTGGAGQRQTYLATPLAPTLNLTTQNYEWTFDIRLDYTTAINSTNTAEIYLFSNQENLFRHSAVTPNSTIEGYFIRFSPQPELFIRNGTTETNVPFTGGAITPLIGTMTSIVTVRRFSDGTWQLFMDGISQGLANDVTFTDNANFFGLNYLFTAAGRRLSCFFDNVSVLPYIDTTPPVVDAVIGMTETQLIIDFDEPLNPTAATNLANYLVDSGIGAPTAASLDPFDPSKVILTFAATFVEGDSYVITVQNVEDLSGNPISPAVDVPFVFNDTAPPIPVSTNVISANALDVRFSEPVDLATAQNPANYSKSAGIPNPTSAVRDATDFALVHLFFPDNFPANSLQFLTVNNVGDLATPPNFMTTPLSVPFIYDTSRPDVCPTGCVIALDANTILVQFSEPVDQTTAEIINAYELLGVGFPTTAIRNPDDPSQVFVTYPTPFTLELEYQVRIRNVEDLAGNVMITRTRAFIYDITPPTVVTLNLLSNTQIELIFDEIVDEGSAENIANYVVDTGIGSPTMATRFDGDGRIVTLDFPGGLGDFETLILTVANVQDLAGNPLVPPQNIPFTTKNPSIGKIEVVSQHLLRVFFSEPVTTATAETLGNYTVGGVGAPIAAEQDAVNPALVRLEFAAAFNIGTAYTLTANGIQDLLGNVSGAIAKGFVYQPQVLSVAVIGPNTLDVKFNYEVVEASAAVPEKYSVSGGVGDALAALVDGADEALVHLSFGTTFDPAAAYILSVGDIFLQNGKLDPISNHPFGFDNTPPSVISVKVLNDFTLEVVFNEKVNSVTAQALNHYPVNMGIGIPTNAVLQANDSIVRLTYAEPFGFGTTYTITVKNVRDLFGNEMDDTNINFSRPTPPAAGALMITEIMSNESPPVGLPENEYLELYNPTSTPQNLLGVRIYDETGFMTLGDYVLEPEAYLIICRNSYVDSFAPYGDVLGVSWRSLRISGELLRLVAPDGTEVFRVNYRRSWYGDTGKDVGGWSLEMIDLNSPCQNQFNWAPSLDSLGGTPGQPNSVDGEYSDTIPPQIESFQVVLTDSLRLKFDKESDSLTLTNTANYAIDGGLSVSDISYINDKEVILRFSADIDVNTIYTLIVSGIVDCAGNVKPDTITFGIGQNALPEQIVITEIMADPTPTVGLPNAEYVEIFNRGSTLVNLNTLWLQDATRSVRLPNYALAPSEYLVLCANSRVDSLLSVGVTNVRGVTSFPSLTISGKPLILRDTSGLRISKVVYSDTWYQDPEKRNGGWSLERIDPSYACGELTNWRASEDPSGGTPGRTNSINGTAPPDNEAPKILSLILAADLQTLTLTFNEFMDSTSMVSPSNYSISGGATIDSIGYINTRSVSIRLTAPINETLLYTLTVNSATDCAGNAASDNASFGRGREPMPGEIVITEIMADPMPQVGLPNAEYIEIHNTSNSLISLEGIKLLDNTATVRTLRAFPMQAGDYVVLCTSSRVDSLKAVAAKPQNVLAVTSFPSLTISGKPLELRNPSGDLLHKVTYSNTWYQDPAKSGGGWSLEMIDPSNLCEEMNNWRASEDPRGGTPTEANSILAVNPDITPPTATRIEMRGDTSVVVFFDEILDSLSLVNPANYNIDNGLGVSSIDYLSERSAELFFATALETGVIYTLSVSSVEDCAGNRMDSTRTFRFGTGFEPQFHELLITEIFANTSPSVGLPQREFLEIYNTTDKVLSLRNVMLSDESRVATLSDAIILPGEYMILCSNTSVPLYEPYGQTMGVTSFPSITIGGKNLVLRNPSGELIFSVRYSDTWYRDNDKKNGGWTLEMIDTEYPCVEAANWRASNDPRGGTPAAVNSVAASNPDNTPPRVQRLSVVSDTLLTVSFTEITDSLAMVNPDNYNISGGISVVATRFADRRSVQLIIAPAIQVNVAYTLTVSNVTDCAGNVMDIQQLPFGLGDKPHYGEILITEIMAKPTPVVGLPEAEYIEIFNPTNKILNLDGVTIVDNIGRIRLPAESILPGQYKLLVPSASANTFAEWGGIENIIPITNWRTLNITGKPMRMRNPDGFLIFEIEYSDRWHDDAEKRDGGWSLEMIDVTNFCAERSNWASSIDPRGGTPSKENSVRAPNRDNMPPKLLRADVIAEDLIMLLFNEKLDSTQAIAFGRITVDNNANIERIYFEGANFKELFVKFSTPLRFRTVYTVTVRNVTDCVGNLIRNDEDNKTTFVLPEAGEIGDLIINEVLHSPPVGGTDFVEIYNRSDKYIDLRDWHMANWRASDDELGVVRRITDRALILAPKSYIVFSNDSEQLKSQYPNGKEETFFEMNLPGYPIAGGTVLLLTPEREIADRFDYERNMHFSLVADIRGVSLERISFDAPTNDRQNWHSAASTVGYGTPGYLNSQSVNNPQSAQAANCFSLSTEVIVPDGDGIDDFVQINYDCEANGQVVTIRIFDMKGRVIKHLVESQLLSATGFIRWDGFDDRSSKARVGYYLILIELFDLNGTVKQIQKKVAVGARF